MVSIATLVRKTPTHLLRAYFASKDIVLADVDWNGGEKGFSKTVVSAIEGLEEQVHGRVVHDAQRFAAMADEAGTVALFSVVSGALAEKLDSLSNGYARAMWLSLEEYPLFQRAEEVRYTDERRRGRSWDGFIGEAEVEVKRDEASTEAFRRAIAEKFGSKNVDVEIFDRYRETSDGRECPLVQATVYSEGRFEEYLEFVEGELDTRGRRPVIEACLTYEPGTGVIEAVAGDRQMREDYARLFSRSLLEVDFDDERLPLRRYDLSPLLKQHEFPTDAGDGIESVRVNSLRLMPLETVSERVTLECMRGGKRNIWEAAAEHFAFSNPLLGGWIVTQAKLSIRFHPESGSSRGKVLPVTITMPHGCDLKDRTERERLIGEKYLHKWRLVEEV